MLLWQRLLSNVISQYCTVVLYDYVRVDSTTSYACSRKLKIAVHSTAQYGTVLYKHSTQCTLRSGVSWAAEFVSLSLRKVAQTFTPVCGKRYRVVTSRLGQFYTEMISLPVMEGMSKEVAKEMLTLDQFLIPLAFFRRQEI